MPHPELLLLLHGGDPGLAVHAQRLRRLGYRVIGARTPEEAIATGAGGRVRVGALLLAAGALGADPPGALEALRTGLGAGAAGALALGPEPGDEMRRRLRAAGVELAAFDPCEDGTLRFQVNHALGARLPATRRETRVPADLPARVHAAGRSKPAMVRALSAGGAYLETRRPSLPGVALRIELSLSPESLGLSGRVVYANVPGNLQRPMLPVGMAVSFAELPERAERAIRHCVAERSLALVV
jgi:hypothetical protein